jgi:microcystin degradation protein MlrC
VPEVYDEFEEEILEGLRQNPGLDGIYLDMHGAMKVDGRDDAEERFLRRVREVVGPDPIISLSMDPHGNMSEELAGYVDLAAVHRHAPHIDTWATRERAVSLLIETIRRGERPLKAWVRMPVLLPGERTSTVVEPGKTVFGSILPAIDRYGVLDAGLWIGFVWADEPRCAASVLVTGYDEEAIKACAEELARTYWDARERFVIVSDHFGPWEEAIDFLLTSPPKPLYISDSGDNVTAGASGDITVALASTLQRADFLSSGKRILFAGLTDPDSVDAAITAGVGAVLDRAIGATVDSRFAGPVPGPWTVESLIDGVFDDGIVGAVLSQGTVSVSVQRFRSPFTRPDEPAFVKRPMPGQAFVDVSDYDAVVVKNGYLFPGQVAEAGSAFMAITVGGTDLDFDRLEFTRLDFPVFPFTKDHDADLTPRIVPAAT